MKQVLKQLLVGGCMGAIAISTQPALAIPFAPPTDNAAPRRTAGGASRGYFFTPPDDHPAPSRSVGGASRGSFFTPPAEVSRPEGSRPETLQEEEPSPQAASRSLIWAMLGLTPQNFYGTTLSGHPTILVYLPATEAQEAVFSLKDEDKNLHFYGIAPISNRAGVYAFQLPTTMSALEVGKNYQWFVTLKVNGRLTPRSPSVDGWIKRIETPSRISTVLAQGDALTQAKTLGAAGIWYDSVTILAALRSQQPNSEAIAEHWTELLSSVGLQEISSAPLVDVTAQHP
jgi:hypothetical protein